MKYLSLIRWSMTITILLSLLVEKSYSQQSKFDLGQFYPIDKSHSFIEFSIKYMGYAKVKGRFGEFSGMVRYDPANLSTTSVTLSIDVQSIDTDLDFRDQDLKSKNWFDTENFPSILFQSKKAVTSGTGFNLIGDLTIRNATKEVTLQMDQPSGVLKDVRGDVQVIFTGQLSIDRTDYGVEGKNWSGVKEGITAVDKIVNIELSILGYQPRQNNFSNRIKNDQQPSGRLYKFLKEKGIQECISEFEKMQKEGGVVENSLSTVARMAHLEGDFDSAISLHTVNIKAFPNSSKAHYFLGESLLAKGELRKAKEVLIRALDLNPKDSQTVELLRYL